MKRDPDAERALLAAALAALLFAGALRAFVSAVYYYNLNTLGLNATAALPLLLLAPALAWRGAARGALLGGAAVLALGRAALPWVGGGLGYLVLAGLAATAGIAFVPALLARTRAPYAVGAGLALGFALDVALLATGRSADPLAERLGGLFALLLGAMLLLFALGLPEPAPATPARRRGILPLALGAWLFLESAILGNPYGIARWNEAGAPITVLAALGGLAVGALAAPRLRSGAALAVVNVVALLAIFDHTQLHSPLVPLSVLLAQAALVVDLVALLDALAPQGFVASARAFGLGAGVMVLLHFLQMFAFLFAYVPGKTLWKGAEHVVAPVALLLVAGGALLAARVGTRAPLRVPLRAVGAAAIVAILVAGAALAKPAEPVGAPRAADSMRLLSFNVHQGFANDGTLDPQLFVRIVRDADADVVVLQESDTTRFSSGNLDLVRILADELGYHSYYGQPTREEGFTGAILSRYPLANASWHALPTTSDNRFVAQATLRVGERDVTLFGVHFGLPAKDRTDQGAELLRLAAAASGPRLLVGDFNSCPTRHCPDYEGEDDDVYPSIAAGWTDAWVASGHDANDTAGYTYSSDKPEERIDQVWLSPEWRATDVQVLRTPYALAASDHLPVLATLRLVS